MRLRRAAFTCFNLAMSRLRMVLRITMNLPFFQVFPQMCVSPKKWNVSGLPSPRRFRFSAANRKRRGEGKPETFHFLGLTHICGKTWKNGKFIVLRKTIRKRLIAKLKQVKAALRRRMHQPLVEVGRWLRSVVQGYFNYHAVPGNLPSLRSFRLEVRKRWLCVIRRRSQRSRNTWELFERIAEQWLPIPKILHPYPHLRFDATHPR